MLGARQRVVGRRGHTHALGGSHAHIDTAAATRRAAAVKDVADMKDDDAAK